MQVTLIDYARDPLEKLYSAFRVCYSQDTPQEIWAKIAEGKISKEKIQRFVGERLRTAHASDRKSVV